MTNTDYAAAAAKVVAQETADLKSEVAKLRQENRALKRAGLRKQAGTRLPPQSIVVLPNGTVARVGEDGNFVEESVGKEVVVDFGGGVAFIPADAAARVGFHGVTGLNEPPAAGTRTIQKRRGIFATAVEKANATPTRLPNSSAPIPGGGLGGRFFS